MKQQGYWLFQANSMHRKTPHSNKHYSYWYRRTKILCTDFVTAWFQWRRKCLFLGSISSVRGCHMAAVIFLGCVYYDDPHWWCNLLPITEKRERKMSWDNVANRRIQLKLFFCSQLINFLKKHFKTFAYIHYNKISVCLVWKKTTQHWCSYFQTACQN